MHATPLAPPISGHKAFFRGGGGGVYFDPHSPPARHKLIPPPPIVYPLPLEGYFQGRGLGVYRTWPDMMGRESASPEQKILKNTCNNKL